MEVVKNYMEEFSRKHYDKIASHLNIEDEDLKEVFHEIVKLNPRPGGDSSAEGRTAQHIIPDFIITNMATKDTTRFITTSWLRP